MASGDSHETPASSSGGCRSSVIWLYALAQKGQIEMQVVQKAIKDLDVDPEKVQPQLV
jgi:pyruvate dehydrogenase complex dehydrogenase (E1) component